MGKIIKKPEIILLSDMGKQLDGATLNVKLSSDNIIHAPFSIKNIGSAPTDPMYVKTYTRKPLVTGTEGSDEKDYDYEVITTPEDMLKFRGVVPSQMSVRLEVDFSLKAHLEEIKDTYPMLIKVYYGGDHPVEARFLIKINRQ